MTSGSPPRVQYSEYFRNVYKDAVMSAYQAGRTAHQFADIGQFDKEQELIIEVQTHLDMAAPELERLGHALDMAMTRLGVNSIAAILAHEPVVPAEAGDTLYVPENW